MPNSVSQLDYSDNVNKIGFMACSMGMAAEKGMQKLQLFGDSLVVVN